MVLESGKEKKRSAKELIPASPPCTDLLKVNVASPLKKLKMHTAHVSPCKEKEHEKKGDATLPEVQLSIPFTDEDSLVSNTEKRKGTFSGVVVSPDPKPKQKEEFPKKDGQNLQMDLLKEQSQSHQKDSIHISKSPKQKETSHGHPPSSIKIPLNVTSTLSPKPHSKTTSPANKVPTPTTKHASPKAAMESPLILRTKQRTDGSSTST